MRETMIDDPRLILALAAEADDEFIWDRLTDIQVAMFAAGPVQIKFAYFGREGASQVRPCITTRWITDADDMREVMERGRAGCVCGCYVNVTDILEQALQEAQQASVQAVVIVGDRFHKSDRAIALAKQLRKAGTRLFLLQQQTHPSGDVDPMGKTLATETGGAFFQFNPTIERVAERLPSLLEAVTHFAVGGADALAARDNESAVLLLEQLEAGRAKIGLK
jgi:hypothetical protein